MVHIRGMSFYVLVAYTSLKSLFLCSNSLKKMKIDRNMSNL